MLTAVLIGAAVAYVFWLYTNRRNLPPGPLPIPVLGNLLYFFFTKDIFSDIMIQLARKHGDIMTFWYGPRPGLLVQSYKAAQNVFITHGDAFNDRPKMPGKIGDGFFSNGEEWARLRKFTTGAFRTLGVGRLANEAAVNDEAEHLLSCLEALEDSDGYTNDDASGWATANVICFFLFGHRFKYTDTEFVDLVRFARLSLQTNGPKTALHRLVPKSFSWLVPGISEMLFLEGRVQTLIDREIASHRLDYNPDDPRDFVDLFIMNNDGSEKISNKSFMRAMHDLLIAGTDTTAAQLGWIFLRLATEPTWQQRISEELETVVGTAQIRMQDKLPLLTAFVSECQRCTSSAPVTIPHVLTNATRLGDWTMRANTMVFLNLAALHASEEDFPNAEQFNPERWLSDDGSFKPSTVFSPFGVGRRSCVGEPLAKMELRLFTACVLRGYNVQLAHPSVSVVFKGKQMATYSPPKYKLQFIPKLV